MGLKGYERYELFVTVTGLIVIADILEGELEAVSNGADDCWPQNVTVKIASQS